MIRFIKGDLFQSGAEALVNTVNCVGVMGKGLALQFKNRYPENYALYRKACSQGRVQPGKLYVVSVYEDFNKKIIINFPTKYHWRNPSEYIYITSGLADLRYVINDLRIRSIAIPPLGCGLGGLRWDVVKNLITDALKDLECEILVYEPEKIN